MSAFTKEQRDEIKQILHEALTEWIRSYSLTTKNLIVGVAAVLIAVAVIGKGIGWFLALIGFSYVK